MPAGLTFPPIKRSVLAVFIDNLRRWLNGEPLVNVVDRTAGY
jgi:hypothetical protein